MFVDAHELDHLIGELDTLPRSIPIRVGVVVRQAGRRTEELGKEFCPVGHYPFDPSRVPGTLRDSISWEPIGDLAVEIGPTARYGWWVEGGTAPHEIRPHTAKALHWIDAGGDHFAKRVWHPGTAPQPYMGPAADAVVPEFEEQLGLTGERALMGTA